MCVSIYVGVSVFICVCTCISVIPRRRLVERPEEQLLHNLWDYTSKSNVFWGYLQNICLGTMRIFYK